MNFSLRLTLLLFIFSLPLLVIAQSASARGKIKGKIYEQSSASPLPFATAILYRTADSIMVTNALSDEDGSFTLSAAKGEYYVSIQFLGFDEYVISDIVLNAEKKVVDLGTINLASDATVLQEVEVTAERSQMEFRLDRRVFNVEKDLTNGGNSAADILDRVPSVSVDAEGNVSLRGSQGVRILVDGKPSGLLSAGETEALLRMQGDIIESVEVITNPSARYEAEGEAGIINIILKKNRKKGVNGSFSATAGYPQNFGGSYSLNYRNRDFNFFSNFGIDYRKSPGGGQATQRFFEDGNLTEFYTTTTDQLRGGYGGYLQFGTDWIIDEQNTITGSLLYRTGRDDNEAIVSYRDFDANQNLLNLTTRDIGEEEESHNLEASLNYTRTFEREGHEWTTVFKYILDDDTELADYDQIDNDGAPRLVQRSSNTEDERNFLFQTDYIYPIGDNSKIEGGLRAALRTVNNDFLVQELRNGDFENLPEFDDNLRYTEDIYAAYFIGAHEFGRWSTQVGLRAELSDITAALLRTNTVNDQDYLSFFPSASVAYEIREGRQLQLSYSRRLSRPYFRRLLPFSNYNNPRNNNIGNPNLRPEFTNAFELGYLQYLKNGSLLTSIYYRNTSGVIERLRLTGEEPGTTILFPVNLSTRNAIGLEMNFSYQPIKWWDLNLDANLFQALTEGVFEDVNYTAETFSWRGRINNKLTISEGLQSQVSFRYNAPERIPQGRRLSSYALDIAASLDIFSGKGTLTLSGRDLFNTRVRRLEIDQVNYQESSFFQWRQTRQVILTFNYRLNQNKQKGAPRNGGEDYGD